MPDLCPLLGFLAFSYGAAVVGLVLALALRLWTARAGRVPTAPEATWCAFLPLLTVLIAPLCTLAEPFAAGPFELWHAVWHEWAHTVHATPLLHGGLHLGNSLLLGIAALTVSRTVYQIARMGSYETSLRRMALRHGRLDETGTYYRLPSPRPVCFTLGLLRPIIYVTDRLLEELSARDREAMLGHEYAHLRRRDPLLRPLLTLFYSFFVLPGGRVLLRDWCRAAERECDVAAGQQIGSRTEVAAALVRVARLMRGHEIREPALSAFAGELDDIEGRVQALLHPEGAGSSPLGSFSGRALLMGISLGMLFPVAFWLRHAVEFFVRH
jgi:hypothetical protein